MDKTKVMNCFQRLFTALALALAALFTAGCSTIETTASASSVTVPALPCAPIQTSFAIDKTGSANHNRTPQPSAATFRPLYGVLLACGGEMAAGIFGSRDNGPLLRLRIEQPRPVPPLPDPNQNPFDYADRRREADATRAAAESFNASRIDDAHRRIAAYETALAGLLAQPASAQCSDIAAGLRRLARYHNEPPAGWSAPPHKYLSAVTDGDHNCGARTLDPLPGVRVLAVNGAPGMGMLNRLNPTPLESFDAAVRLIVTETEPKGKE